MTSFFDESAFSEVFLQNHAWKLGVWLIHEYGTMVIWPAVFLLTVLLCIVIYHLA